MQSHGNQSQNSDSKPSMWTSLAISFVGGSVAYGLSLVIRAIAGEDEVIIAPAQAADEAEQG